MGNGIPRGCVGSMCSTQYIACDDLVGRNGKPNFASHGAGKHGPSDRFIFDEVGRLRKLPSETASFAWPVDPSSGSSSRKVQAHRPGSTKRLPSSSGRSSPTIVKNPCVKSPQKSPVTQMRDAAPATSSPVFQVHSLVGNVSDFPPDIVKMLAVGQPESRFSEIVSAIKQTLSDLAAGFLLNVKSLLRMVTADGLNNLTDAEGQWLRARHLNRLPPAEREKLSASVVNRLSVEERWYLMGDVVRAVSPAEKPYLSPDLMRHMSPDQWLKEKPGEPAALSAEQRVMSRVRGERPRDADEDIGKHFHAIDAPYSINLPVLKAGPLGTRTACL